MTTSSNGPKRVLFLCTHNSAQSQMAEGFLRASGGDAFEVFSAGTVATRVRPEAITVMQELGIDITGQTSKTLERFLSEPFDEVITVCDDANETCPFSPVPRPTHRGPIVWDGSASPGYRLYSGLSGKDRCNATSVL